MVEAWRAAIEIGADLARRGQSPKDVRFEVCDQVGRMVFELPFADVLARPAVRPRAAPDVMRDRLGGALQRSRELQVEVAKAVGDLRDTLGITRSLLSRR